MRVVNECVDGVVFTIVFMDSSLFVWVYELANPKIDHLQVAIQSSVSRLIPCDTQLGKRLSEYTRCVVHLSYNVSDLLEYWVEKQLLGFLDVNELEVSEQHYERCTTADS
jgi:hypothetical protein